MTTNTQGAADLIAALKEAQSAINSMKVEAETAAQGDEQMMLEACETISNEGLQADMAIRAALAFAAAQSKQETEATHLRELAAYRLTVENLEREIAAQQPAQSSVPAEWLEQAFREGWAACRDSEFVGEEAEEWAFGSSQANGRMIDIQQAAPTAQADTQPAPLLDAREAFEAWHREVFKKKYDTGQPTRDKHNGVYDEKYGPVLQQRMWEAWQAHAAHAPADSVLEDAFKLLDEVAQCFTTDDALPDNLLPRIDAVIAARAAQAAQKEGKA